MTIVRRQACCRIFWRSRQAAAPVALYKNGCHKMIYSKQHTRRVRSCCTWGSRCSAWSSRQKSLTIFVSSASTISSTLLQQSKPNSSIDPITRRAIGNGYVPMPWRNGSSVSRRSESSMTSTWRKASSKLQPWVLSKAILSLFTARNTRYESHSCFTTRHGDQWAA